MTRVLVVAAHPDDEVLGAGGAIAWHRHRKDPVSVLILGEGISSRFDNRKEALKVANRLAFLRLQKQMAQAHRRLKVTNTFRESFPDNRFDGLELLDIIKVVERVKRVVKPEIVYTHHTGDLNVDHRLTAEAVLTAFRLLPGESVRRVLSFEVLSSTESAPPDPSRSFRPNVFIDISRFLKTKLAAMGCYKSELRPFPHPRSLQALEAQARLWGAKAGLPAAEAFMLLRERIS